MKAYKQVIQYVYQPNEQLNLLTHRCDQCNHRCIKCDRQIPKCSSCIRSGIECTLLRKTKNKQRMVKVNDNHKINTIKLNIISQHKNNLINQSKMTYLDKFHDPSYNTALSIINQIPSKNVKENLLCLLQYPSLTRSNNGLNFFIDLTLKQGLLLNRRKTIPNVKSIKINFDLKYNIVLAHALNSFFLYLNSVYSFIYAEPKDFPNFSPGLKMAILANGLCFLPKDNIVCELMDFFSYQLSIRYKDISKLKPSLSNIQTVLLLLPLRNYPWAHRLYYIYLYFCFSTASQIGLHIPSNGFSNRVKIERQLVYNYLGFYASYFSILATPNLFSFIRYSKHYRISYLLKDPIIFLKCTNFKSKFNAISFYSRVYNDFLADIAHCLFKICHIKDSIRDGKNDFNSLLPKIITVFKQINCVRINFLTLFCEFYKIQNNHSDPIIIQNMQNGVLILSHYSIFFIFSLSFYHSNPLGHKLKKKQYPIITAALNHLPNQYKNLLDLTLNEASKVVSLFNNIDLTYHISFVVSILCQCLVFILRYKESSNSKEDLQSNFNKGFQVMQSLTHNNIYQRLAEYNIAFINQVKSNIEK